MNKPTYGFMILSLSLARALCLVQLRYPVLDPSIAGSIFILPPQHLHCCDPKDSTQMIVAAVLLDIPHPLLLNFLVQYK